MVDRRNSAIPIKPEVSPAPKIRAKRSKKAKPDPPGLDGFSPLDPARGSAPGPVLLEVEPPPQSPLDAPLDAPPSIPEWDRTFEEKRQQAEARALDRALANTSFPTPPAKTLAFLEFCRYYNELIKLPVSKYVRLYIHRWFPSLLPEIVDDIRTGMKRETFPGEDRLTAADGPLSEQLLLDRIGVGDYTLRLNDSRLPFRAGTVVHCEMLSTKRDYDHHPPVFDLARLDYDDPKNAVYIKMARAKGILPREGEQEDNENMGLANTIVEDARKDRERADQLQREELARSRQEAQEAKEALAREQAAKAKTTAAAMPQTELVSTIGGLVNVLTAIRPERDNSLSDYLKLEAEREASRRERDKQEREKAYADAAAERKRADDLQHEILTELRAKAAAPAVAPPAPLSLAQQFTELETVLATVKRIGKFGGAPEEETAADSKANALEQWGTVLQHGAPVILGIIQGFFQTIQHGFTSWQNVTHNNLLSRNGATMPDAKPIPPTAPPPTPQQQTEQQQFMALLISLEEAAPPIMAAIDDGDSGFDFAEMVIKFKRRPAYDQIRQLGLGPDGAYTFERFAGVLRTLMSHQLAGPKTKELYAKVAELKTFGDFLKDFFDHDEISEQQAAKQAGSPE